MKLSLTDNNIMTGHLDQKIAIFSKVVVIGLGQLGLPVAKYVKERGFDIFGYDINAFTMDRAEKEHGIKKINDFSDMDVFIICVSTHKPDDIFAPYLDGLYSVVHKISNEARNGTLVSIESTIPCGTSKKVFELLDHRLHVVHAPHRWYALEEDIHGVNQLRVIGGVCECCLHNGLRFYDNAESHVEQDELKFNRIKDGNRQELDKTVGISMHPVSNVELAELTKIVENADRYLQIAFAEELYLYCQANHINFSELKDALNTKWNVQILEPREGIGGHCVPKDTKMFLDSSKTVKSKILLAAIEADQDYRKFRQMKDRQHSSDNTLGDRQLLPS
jgi:UDP-N-acetyl-D-mannosaminuronic acid dehydrogenase